MAGLLAPQYWGTMIRVWFENGGPKPKAFVLQSHTVDEHDSVTAGIEVLIQVLGPVTNIEFTRIGVDAVTPGEDGSDRIKVDALSLKEVDDGNTSREA